MKRKTRVPLLTHSKQKVTWSQAKNLLASWDGDSSSSGRRRNNLRFIRWWKETKGTARVKRPSISDVCEAAERYGVKVPASTARNSNVEIKDASVEGAIGYVGQVRAGATEDIMRELQDELVQKDAEISRLKIENEGLTKANNKIYGHRGWG